MTLLDMRLYDTIALDEVHRGGEAMIARMVCWISWLLLCAGAQAAAVTATYTPLAGNTWLVGLSIENDGTIPSIGGFTVYFDEGLFDALLLQASPATWDSLLVQPDTSIPDAGFLDALAIDPADELGVGQSIGGWTVQFSYLGNGRPGALSFDIVDGEFNTLFSGLTAVVSPVSEPGTVSLLVAAALAAGGLRRGQRKLR